MRIRQSDLKQWQQCPLKYRYAYIDKLPRQQSGSLTFGSIMHDCVLYLETTHDLAGAIARFRQYWLDPQLLDPSYAIEYYVRGTNWKKYSELGPRLLTDWWSLIQWDSDANIAREHHFIVPIGDGHELEGTADKIALRFMPKLNRWVLLISDYKTNSKVPTYEYLNDDLQFTAYAYASTRPEFWEGIPNGEQLHRVHADTPRYGEWVSLTATKRMDAGERTQQQYNRLAYAVNQVAESIAMRIFVPTISGESCRWCEYRRPCGLPELDDAGQPVAA